MTFDTPEDQHTAQVTALIILGGMLVLGIIYAAVGV